MDFCDTELVVLSAGERGWGDLTAGQEAQGLRNALKQTYWGANDTRSHFRFCFSGGELLRRIFSIGRPFASSSTSLSR